MVESLRWQREHVTAAGSPVAALILETVIDEVQAGGALGGKLPSETRFGDMLGLRVMAAVHLLALQRRAPRVALHLPTLGGRAPRDGSEQAGFRRAVVEALAENELVLEETLQRTPQTNEPGRAALLRIGLAREDPARPALLREIGASAGLNLRADRLPGLSALEAGPLPTVIDRLGCDLDPIDIATQAGRSLLSSYVWVDDVERFERLRHALEIAANVPASVVRRHAADFVRSLRPRHGATTVIWQSAMWVYLRSEERREVFAAIHDAGRLATASAPLSHVSWEWYGTATGDAEFSLVRRHWDGGPNDGRPCLLATGLSHGGGVRLAAGSPWLESDPLLGQG